MNVKYRKAFFTDVENIIDIKKIEGIELIYDLANRCKVPEEIPGYKALRQYPGKARIEIAPFRIGVEVIGNTIIFKRILSRKIFYSQFP